MVHALRRNIEKKHYGDKIVASRIVIAEFDRGDTLAQKRRSDAVLIPVR
jgi:hypothetical protein